jgi:hypothetical protein
MEKVSTIEQRQSQKYDYQASQFHKMRVKGIIYNLSFQRLIDQEIVQCTSFNSENALCDHRRRVWIRI